MGISLNRLFTSMKNRLAREDGLTLVEILVSMMVFLIVSAGVAGTLTSGLKATAHTKLATMGKAQAQEQIEEMRSRVFYVPYSEDADVGSTADVDLLDLYYPSLNTTATTDGQGWQGWFTAGGGDAFYTRESPVDEMGIVRTVETRFIDNLGNVIVPDASYDTNTVEGDFPPSNLVEVSVTTSWLDRTGANSYQLVSRISATGQAVQGAGDSLGEQGCNSTSRSYVDSIGGIFTIHSGNDDDDGDGDDDYDGDEDDDDEDDNGHDDDDDDDDAYDPFTDVLSGIYGEGYASVETGCENQVIGRGTSGSYTINSVTQNAAEASAIGPPGANEYAGPTSVGPLAGWPSISITNGVAEGFVEAEDMEGHITAQGEARLGGMSASIYEVDGWPGDSVSGYRRWDFLNPVVQVSGPGGDDQFWSELQQEGLHAEGVGKIHLPQINILPLEAKTSNTPSAFQGLIFIRNFTAEVHSHAGQGTGTNTITYSATIGMFNPSKSASCTGDACYDLYASIGPNNPIQTAISLADSNYRLQNALFSEFHSFTASEIMAATYGDDTAATVNIDALLKISAKIGTEIRWKTGNPHLNQITLIDEQGYGDFWLGGYDVSLNEAS